MFGLGLALIIDAAVTPNGRSSLIITGRAARADPTRLVANRQDGRL